MLITHPLARSQKVKGLDALRGANGMGIYSIPSLLRLYQSLGEIDPLLLIPSRGLFARPCPVRPRHGFVDSRVIKSIPELQQVMRETLEADPLGEVMLMNPIQANYNAVWVPALLSIGLGNDGATAGHDVVSIPLAGGRCPIIIEASSKGGVGVDEDPYVEGVRDNYGQWHLTQLRAGPRVGRVGGNIIPFPVQVLSVIKVQHQSLIEWESIMLLHKDEEGLVVYHPGGSPTDHYTVHARACGLPIILIGDCPSLGDELPQSSEEIILDPKAILKGIVAGDLYQPNPSGEKIQGRESDICLILTALYNSSVMGGEDGFWLGMASSLMLRYGTTACRGEARHVLPLDKSPVKPGVLNKMGRDEIYSRSLPWSISRHRSAICRLISCLRYGRYSGNGIGGEKWAKCGAALIPLFNAIGALSREQSIERSQDLIRALNLAVDQAHNNGWWMNKFADPGCFTGVQTGRLNYLMSAGVTAHRAKGLVLDEDVITRRITRYAGWNPLVYHPPKIDQIELLAIPGINGMSFKIRSKLLRSAHKDVMIPIPRMVDIFNSEIGSLYIKPNQQGGLQIEARRGHQTPIKMWEDEPLDPVLVSHQPQEPKKK